MFIKLQKLTETYFMKVWIIMLSAPPGKFIPSSDFSFPVLVEMSADTENCRSSDCFLQIKTCRLQSFFCKVYDQTYCQCSDKHHRKLSGGLWSASDLFLSQVVSFICPNRFCLSLPPPKRPAAVCEHGQMMKVWRLIVGSDCVYFHYLDYVKSMHGHTD